MKIHFLILNLLMFPQIQCMQWFRKLFSKKPELYKDLTDQEKSELIGAPNDKRPLTEKQKKVLVTIASTFKRDFYLYDCSRRVSNVKSAVKKHKIHPNCQGLMCHQRSTLYDAVYCNNKKYTQFLLAHGADPNERVKWFGITMPLLSVAKDIDSTKLLLDYKANPNTYDAFGFTPLFHAISNKSKESVDKVRLLIKYGALLSLKFHTFSFPQYILICRNDCLNGKEPDKSKQKSDLDLWTVIRHVAIEEESKRKQIPFMGSYLMSGSFPPKALSIVQSYFDDEPDYEALEKIPLLLPPREKKKKQRKWRTFMPQLGSIHENI